MDACQTPAQQQSDHHSGEKMEGPSQWREEGGITTVERRGRDHHSGEKREGPPQWREDGGTTTVERRWGEWGWRGRGECRKGEKEGESMMERE